MYRLSVHSINLIISKLPYGPAIIEEIRESIHQNITQRFYLELRKCKSSKNINAEASLSRIIENCNKLYLKSISQPGTPIGMITAEAIMAPMTQNALNSFHHAGTEKGAVAGLTNSSEIINASPNRKDPRIVVHFLNKKLRYDEIYALSSQMVGVVVQSLIQSDTTHEMKGDVCNEGWFDQYLQVKGIEEDPRSTNKYVQKIKFNVDRLYEVKVTLSEICRIIEGGRSSGITCIPSPTYLGVIYIFINYNYFLVRTEQLKIGQIAGAKPEDRERNIFYLVSTHILKPRLSTSTVRGIEGINFVKPRKHETLSLVLFEDTLISSEDYSFIHLDSTMQRNTSIPYIKLINLFEECGFECVWCSSSVSKSYSVREPPKEIKEEIDNNLWPYSFVINNNGGNSKSRIEEMILENKDNIDSNILIDSEYWYADVGGNNLFGIMMLPFVDQRNTYGTSYRLFEKIQGIDITRNLLIREYMSLLSDPYVNPIYIINQVNTQTCMGVYTATTAQSATRKNVGTLPQASFQQATATFTKAAPFAKEEDVINTSSCIFLARPINIGSGHFEAYEDKDLQAKYQRTQQLMQHWSSTVQTDFLVPHNVKIAQIGSTEDSDDLYEENYAGLPPPYKPPAVISRSHDISDYVSSIIGNNYIAKIRLAVPRRQINFDAAQFLELLLALKQ